MQENFENHNLSANTLDDMTKKQLGQNKETSRGWLKWTFVFLLMVAIGAGAWFVFGSSKEPFSPKVSLEIEGPENLPSSGDVSLRVIVNNENSFAVQDLRLQIVYPSGFSYISSVPTAEGISGTSFVLADLPQGQNASFILRLRVQANVGDAKQLKTQIRYKTQGTAAVFAAEKTREWSVVGSGLDLEIEGTKEAGNGELISYTASYSNKTESVLSSAKLSVQLPTSFKVGKAEPAATLGESSWLIPRLDPGQSGSVTIYGNFDGAQLGNEEVVRATFSVLGSSGSYAIQADSSFATLIKSQPLSVTQELQNSTKSVLNAGERVSYVIKYQNNSTSPVKNLKIVFKVEGKGVNWSDVRAEDASIQTGSVTWSTATSPLLSVLRPGEKGTFTVELPILNPPVKDSSQNLNLMSSVTISADEYRAPLSGNSLEVRIASRPQLKASLEFVSGANPPRVGQETTYKAILSLSNTSNEIKSAKVTARLPLGSGSLQVSSLPVEVKLESSASKITWDVGNLKAYAGSFEPVATTNFLIRLIPTAAQAGEEVFVLSDLLLTGTDSFTSRQVSVKTLDLSTESAAFGSRRGRVVK